MPFRTLRDLGAAGEGPRAGFRALIRIGQKNPLRQEARLKSKQAAASTRPTTARRDRRRPGRIGSSERHAYDLLRRFDDQDVLFRRRCVVRGHAPAQIALGLCLRRPLRDRRIQPSPGRRTRSMIPRGSPSRRDASGAGVLSRAAPERRAVMAPSLAARSVERLGASPTR